MTLLEVSPLEVQSGFPAFFHQNSRFFLLNHEDQEVGIVGVKFIDSQTCELSLCIFKDYRFKIPYKKTLKLLLNYPYTLGFAKILIATREQSVETLLMQCQRLGVKFLGIFKDRDNHPPKVWFEAERLAS
jgi:hypothetical protein